MMIAEKMQEEKERQEKLRKARETCLPCAGTWPNCECGGNVQALKNRDIKKLQVTRAGDEADGVDQTLPRNDTIKSLLNYGKPALGSGSQCSRSAECSSNFCVGGILLCQRNKRVLKAWYVQQWRKLRVRARLVWRSL